MSHTIVEILVHQMITSTVKDKFITLKSASLRMLKHHNLEEIKSGILVKISNLCNAVREEEGVVMVVEEIHWPKAKKSDKVEDCTLTIGAIHRQHNEERRLQNEIRPDFILTVDVIRSCRILVLVMLIDRFQTHHPVWIVKLLQIKLHLLST